MSFDPYEFDRDYGQSSRMESIGQYTAKTFLWMVLGLLVTFGIALLGWVTNATLYALAYVPYIHLIVLIATIVLSITMVSRIEKMSVGTARGIFIAFSALFGFTMSMYLYIFEFGSLIFVFLATAPHPFHWTGVPVRIRAGQPVYPRLYRPGPDLLPGGHRHLPGLYCL